MDTRLNTPKSALVLKEDKKEVLIIVDRVIFLCHYVTCRMVRIDILYNNYLCPIS